MSHCHIGVPKFIENGFSKNHKVAKIDLIRKKIYFESIDTLGTKKNYYDKVIENALLSKGVETRFSSFITKLKSEKKMYLTQTIIKNNIDTILEFVKFAYLRSTAVFESVKSGSITADMINNFSHSVFLAISSQIYCNSLQMLNDEITIFMVINETEKNFINNSLGVGYRISKKCNFSFFWLPITTTKGIIIKTFEDRDLEITHYIADTLNCVEELNEIIFLTEKAIGNGFIFGESEEDIKSFNNRV